MKCAIISFAFLWLICQLEVGWVSAMPLAQRSLAGESGNQDDLSEDGSSTGAKHNGPRLVGYVERWDHHFDLSMIPDFVDVVTIAFNLVEDGRVNTTLTTVNCTEKEVKDQIKDLKKRGKELWLSIGGASNCGEDLYGDYMFGTETDPDTFGEDVAQMLEDFDLDGVDMDYECLISPSDTRQSYDTADAATRATKELSGNETAVSWLLFPTINSDEEWIQQTEMINRVHDVVDELLWMSYNVEADEEAANAWYETAIERFERQVVPLSAGQNCSNAFFGVCTEAEGETGGCPYGPGPSDEIVEEWAHYVKENNCGGIFFWTLGKEYEKNGRSFKGSLIEKVASILHGDDNED